MVCPFCTNKKTSVYNSRPTARLNNVWRRRRCDACKKSFTTNEMVDPSSVLNIKVGRSLRNFSPSTLLLSILRSCDHLDEMDMHSNYVYQTVLQKLYKQAAANSGLITKDDINLLTLE